MQDAFQLFGLGPVSPGVENALYFIQKHRDSPVRGMKEWVVHVFEFGGCLLDPQGLIKRYEELQQWGRSPGKDWVNYWTVTVPKKIQSGSSDRSQVREDSSDDGYVTAEDREGDFKKMRGIVDLMREELQSEPGLSLALPTTSTNSDGNIVVTSSTLPNPAATQRLTNVGSPESQCGSADVTTRRSFHDEVAVPWIPIVAVESQAESQAGLSQEAIAKEAKHMVKEMKKKEKERIKAGKEEEKARKAEKKAEEQRLKREKKEREKAVVAAEKQAKGEKTSESSHHFIVLPRQGTDEKWVKVPVAGADSEVTAHCGLFFRDENEAYDLLVENVSNLIERWWRSSI